MGDIKIHRGPAKLATASPSTRAAAVVAAASFLGLAAGLFSSRLPVVIVFGLVGGAALFLLVYRYPWLGLGLFAFFNLTIPQAGPTWNLGIQVAVVGETRGIHFNLHEIVITILFLAVVLRVFTGRQKAVLKSPLTPAVVLYVLTSILACFVGLIHDANGLVVAFRFIRTVIFFYIFYLVLNIITTRRAFRNMVILMLICFTLVALFGLVQKAIGQTKTEWVAEHVLNKLGYPEDVNYVAGESEAQAYRINSTFLHPNVLGGLLVFALPFFISLLSLCWREERRWAWFLLLAGLGINLAALFLTGSRAAWVAAGCIFIIYGVFGIRSRRMWLAGCTVVIILALVFVMLSPPEFVKKRFVSLSAREAAQARLYQYQMAVDFFMEHPFLGLGMGMEGQRIVENNLRATWAAVENAFLTYLVSHGLVGLVAFLLLFLLYWWMLFKTHENSEEDPFLYFMSEAFGLGMVGYAAANMFGAWLLFAIPMVTLFWFFLGMGGSLYRLFEAGEGREAA